jgi:hypothetical protein
MLRLPFRFTTIILYFGPLFRHRRWLHAEVRLLGVKRYRTRFLGHKVAVGVGPGSVMLDCSAFAA